MAQQHAARHVAPLRSRAVADERIYLSPPDMSGAERTYLLEAFDSNWIAPVGPDLNAFEGTLGSVDRSGSRRGPVERHCWSSSCAVVGGVTPGDEVLVSTFTFVATANAVLQCGATPVFVDSSAADWNIDPDLVAQELAERAKHGRLPAAWSPWISTGNARTMTGLNPSVPSTRFH